LYFLLQSCEELVSCLSRGDFADFTAQLEGLASIYQLNAEKKVKCKAFSALQSLEADLGTLATLQSFIKEPFNLVHKSPVGIVEKRRGGMFLHGNHARIHLHISRNCYCNCCVNLCFEMFVFSVNTGMITNFPSAVMHVTFICLVLGHTSCLVIQ
jgi:hypothetical protein